MKKLLFPLFAVVALTFAACSSDKDDKDGNGEGPVGTHYYTIATEDMSWGKADMSYVADFFSDDVRMFTIEGTKSGADQKALERYNEILSQINDEQVCNAFPSVYDESMQEYLYFAVHLTRTEGRPDTLASKRWALNGVEVN
ncbi:MAG: hypothetical protein J6P49_05070 [Paludibacteraceae bacterium]|nr:hypothetical protein [Paludibacteraceae bacterium]MBP5135976.1 hypothetical protein [Paludibacteraceae bacterium]